MSTLGWSTSACTCQLPLTCSTSSAGSAAAMSTAARRCRRTWPALSSSTRKGPCRATTSVTREALPARSTRFCGASKRPCTMSSTLQKTHGARRPSSPSCASVSLECTYAARHASRVAGSASPASASLHRLLCVSAAVMSAPLTSLSRRRRPTASTPTA